MLEKHIESIGFDMYGYGHVEDDVVEL